MIEERRLADRLADVMIWGVLALLGIICVIPFVSVFAKSVSESVAVQANKVSLWPIGFHLDNYRYLTEENLFLTCFRISVLRVFSGVAVNVLVTAITAYPLSRDHIHMPGRTAFKMIINFFRGLPPELSESAVLDGPNHADILFRIFLPLSLPSLATIALFSAVSHWNSWFDGIVYMRLNTQWPVQSYLYSRLTAADFNSMFQKEWGEVATKFQNATPEALKSAMIMLTSLPIMMVYPFMQRYFVTGLTLGSVKG